MPCLVDTGSMVTTVSEEFYNEKFPDKHLESGGLKITAANGLEVPYLGILCLPVEVNGVLLQEVGVLVVRTPADKDHQTHLPGILGTNVLINIPEYANLIGCGQNWEI